MEQKIKEYTARISQATPIDLSIISSEICITYLDKSIELIDLKEFDKNYYNECINKTKEIVLEKLKSFNRSEKLGQDLTHIFFTINQLIADAQFSYNKEKLLEARGLILGQMEIFKIAKENKVGENNKKVINSSEKIIAGLTYSNGKLDEFIDDTSSTTFNA